MHDERREGELTPERIGEIWLEVQRESLGPAFELRRHGLRDLLGLYPALHPLAVLRLRLCVRRLPGELALCGLPAARIRASRRSISTCCGPAAPSGTRSCWRRSASMPSDPAFWTKGLGVIAGFIDELESAGRDGPAVAMTDERTPSAGGCGATRASGARSAGWRRASPASAISASRLDRGEHAAELTAALGGLKGPLMKVAQILSTIPDALPAEYVAGAAQLQANAPPMGWPFVRAAWRRSWAPDWQEQLRELRARGRRRGLARPGASRDRRTTARRSPASCSTPTWRRRSRPICASCS